MSNHLVCARCAGPVAEGRCPVCRAARERLDADSGVRAVLLAILLAILAALTVLVVTTQRYAFA
jgi:hypothetical protein